jgi:hypothetical protein
MKINEFESELKKHACRNGAFQFSNLALSKINTKTSRKFTKKVDHIMLKKWVENYTKAR